MDAMGASSIDDRNFVRHAWVGEFKAANNLEWETTRRTNDDRRKKGVCEPAKKEAGSTTVRSIVVREGGLAATWQATSAALRSPSIGEQIKVPCKRAEERQQQQCSGMLTLRMVGKHYREHVCMVLS